jgi:hypothetical protein
LKSMSIPTSRLVAGSDSGQPGQHGCDGCHSTGWY